MTMTPAERREVFGDFDPDRHQAEADQRWGGTSEYQESMRRTRRYGKAEWTRIKEESGEIYGELARLLAAGVAPAATEAMDAAERHRQHISRWFYPCSLEIHRGLGAMYVDDPRFTATIDRFGAGVSAYARDAFRANAERQERGISDGASGR